MLSLNVTVSKGSWIIPWHYSFSFLFSHFLKISNSYAIVIGWDSLFSILLVATPFVSSLKITVETEQEIHLYGVHSWWINLILHCLHRQTPFQRQIIHIQTHIIEFGLVAVFIPVFLYIIRDNLSLQQLTFFPTWQFWFNH